MKKTHKLTRADADLIRAAAVERKRLRAEANKLSNDSLAEKFGVHPRSIEKILSREIHYR